jgi:hypothetical protein
MFEESGTKVINGITYSCYKCPGASIILQHEDGFIQAYIVHHHFSRDVYRLMEYICKKKMGTIKAETKDIRMARFMQRLGFSLVGQDEEAYKLEFIGE